MNNVFLLSKSSFSFKEDVFRKLVEKQANKQIQPIINTFFSEEHTKPLDHANFIRDLLTKITVKDNVEKLLNCLVYLATLIQADQIIKIFQSIQNVNISPLILVKFYSFVFKSVNDNRVKKWVISSSLDAMETEQKTTPFISFVQNFDLIIGTLHLQAQQLIELYWKLIKYLEKHLIYKKLVSRYVFIALSNVNDHVSSTETVKNLLVKAIYSDHFEDIVTELLNKAPIKSHALYPLLEARITGDVNVLSSITIWQKYNLEKQKISRKVRIQAIPRLFKHIKQASYAQAGQLLGIEKKQVQSYIIEAVRLGIMKAKLDEYQQTIIINKLNIRCLQKDQQVQLQKEISDLCQSLQKFA